MKNSKKTLKIQFESDIMTKDSVLKKNLPLGMKHESRFNLRQHFTKTTCSFHSLTLGRIPADFF